MRDHQSPSVRLERVARRRAQLAADLLPPPTVTDLLWLGLRVAAVGTTVIVILLGWQGLR